MYLHHGVAHVKTTDAFFLGWIPHLSGFCAKNDHSKLIRGSLDQRLNGGSLTTRGDVS